MKSKNKVIISSLLLATFYQINVNALSLTSYINEQTLIVTKTATQTEYQIDNIHGLLGAFSSRFYLPSDPWFEQEGIKYGDVFSYGFMDPITREIKVCEENVVFKTGMAADLGGGLLFTDPNVKCVAEGPNLESPIAVHTNVILNNTSGKAGGIGLVMKIKDTWYNINAFSVGMLMHETYRHEYHDISHQAAIPPVHYADKVSFGIVQPSTKDIVLCAENVMYNGEKEFTYNGVSCAQTKSVNSK